MRRSRSASPAFAAEPARPRRAARRTPKGPWRSWRSQLERCGHPPKRRTARSVHVNALLSFSSPSAYKKQGATRRRGCLPRLRASSGFLNLSTLCSPCDLTGLFHPVTAPGVFTLQRLSPVERRTPLGSSCPSWRWLRRARLQGFKRPTDPCSHPNAREGARTADPLLGFNLSRVPCTRRRTPSRGLPSCAFHVRGPKASSAWRSRVSIDGQGDVPLPRAPQPS